MDLALIVMMDKIPRVISENFVTLYGRYIKCLIILSNKYYWGNYN